MAAKKPLSPAEWGKSHPAKTPGSKCYICSNPEVSKLVDECVDNLKWDGVRTWSYLREEHGFPRQRNALQTHVREHRK